MKIYSTQMMLIFSVVLNILLGVFLFISNYSCDESGNKEFDNSSEFITLQKSAEAFVRKAVCDNLYYPNTYDPVSTTIDSVFYGPLTDKNCIQAAIELIGLRSEYSSFQTKYNNAIDNIKFFGTTDIAGNHWGKDRDAAKKEMERIKEKIKYRQAVIRNRDTSMDGDYIGWQIIHRYRAANSDSKVSFGNELYILSPGLTECYFRFMLDSDSRINFKVIKDVIETELGIFNDK